MLFLSFCVNSTSETPSKDHFGRLDVSTVLQEMQMC
jgi:hypothetical protein